VTTQKINHEMDEVAMIKPPVVIVTGASRGLGAATSIWLARAGAVVALLARTGDDLRAVARQIEEAGGQAIMLTTDVGNAAACHDAVESVLRKTGGVNALVNNAGVLAPLSTIAEADPDKWRQNIKVNLLGPFYMIQSALSALRASRGRVINVSSGAATNPTGAWSAYCAAKAGLNHLTSVLALEEPDVTAISIRPGVVDTEMQDQIRSEGQLYMASDKVTFFQRLKEEGNLLPPEVPARAIAWLALNAPHKWSGQFLSYDQEDIAGPAAAFCGNS
jgi:NAD(P)-dependent dehydrogenase (short-subunit alcohol dehydrogenase family)